MKAKNLWMIVLGAAVLSTAACTVTGPRTVSTTGVNIMVDYRQFDSIEQLADSADLVVWGTITGSRVQQIDDAIQPTTDDPTLNPGGDVTSSSMTVYTVYTLAVDNCYKGCGGVGDSIEFRQIGGLFDGVQYTASPRADVQLDHKYVLFLSTYPDTIAGLLNPPQSVYIGDDGPTNGQSLDPQNPWTASPDDLVRLFR